MQQRRYPIVIENIGKVLTYQEEYGTILSGTIVGVKIGQDVEHYIVEWHDTGEQSCWNSMQSPCKISK